MARQEYYIVTTDDSVPASTAGTGTISTSTVGGGGQYIVGSSTSFTDELTRGGYIVDVTNHECRRIKSVIDDENLVVEGSFSNTLSGVDLKYIPKDEIDVIFMEIDNTGGSDTTIDGVTIASGTTRTFGQPDNNDPKRYVTPKIVDGDTSNCTITLTYSRKV